MPSIAAAGPPHTWRTSASLSGGYGRFTTVDTRFPFQVVFDLATLVTVKVADVTLIDSDVDTEQVPVAPVVHVLVPLAPADNCTVTVAPETAVPVDASITLVVAPAVQDRLLLVADPVMVACVVVTAGGGDVASRV